MNTFTSEADAAAAGFTVTHDDAAQCFLLQAGDRTVGEAHYQLLPGDSVNFHHTVVHPQFRGTGLSGVLAHHALTSDIARSRTIRASCWFMAKYLRDNPQLLGDA